MKDPVYNTVGKGYNNTRCADPYITSRLYDLLQPITGGCYLDAGCGTGNYTEALSTRGLFMTGIDPSERMLDEARKKLPGTELIQTGVESLPFGNDTFNGTTATFTIHHWNNKLQGLKEIYRVLQPGSNLVLLSFTPQQVMGYWLCKYFPVTMERSAAVVEDIDNMNNLFRQAGFNEVSTEKYFVHDELIDHFLYANKHRPERYLDPQVRNGASSFTVYADQQEVAQGLKQLEADIHSGHIDEVIREYENDLGDYLFYCVTKH